MNAHFYRMILRLALLAGYLVMFLWLNSLTVVGSDAWMAHLRGLPPLLELPVYASSWLCLLAGILSVTGRLPARYSAIVLAFFLVLGFAILRFWYVPSDPSRKRSAHATTAA